MGLFDTLAAMLKFKKEQINILVVGLNNSGKSTIVNHFKSPEEKSSVTVPTVGFSVEKFQTKTMYVTGFQVRSVPETTLRLVEYLLTALKKLEIQQFHETAMYLLPFSTICHVKAHSLNVLSFCTINQGVNFTAFDMSGAGRYRSLWEHHFKSSQGIVFVIDSSDRMRLVVVKDELDTLLHHPDIEDRKVPILLFANKMDNPEALSSVKIAAALGLEKIKDKPWHISSSNALTGDGLQDGVQWLVQQIRDILTSSRESNSRK